jgi:hypothetical protein
LKTLYHAKFINYIHEAIQENLQTSSSAANEVSARVDLLHAVQFITNSWRTVITKTIQNCFADCGFKHSKLGDAEIRQIVKMTYWKYTTSEITKFSCIDNSLHYYKENEDSEEATVEQTGAKHQKTTQNQEIMTMTWPILNE